MDRAGATRVARELCEHVERVIRGKREVVEAVATALLAGGHILIEDVPGVGKTMLARAVARSVRGTFKRIQATPDLLPADITGSNVFHRSTERFEFVPGPLFANIVLIDEINRATPRTQSALLEAMEEGAVTVDGERHPLPEPLLVIATQNPLEHLGTYPLPEGQLDRFALAIDIGYVDAVTEREVVEAQLGSHPIEELDAIVNPEDVLGVRKVVRGTHVSEAVLDYAISIVRGTRAQAGIELGASPRASITLVRCAQARALLRGRDYVVPDDVKALAVRSLAHRVVAAGPRSSARGPEEAVREVVSRARVPVGARSG
ncbi:MAG TPA: MoxR family ATPase [Actinomycetota bacterium]|jgi:MoxR-like ATPase|nr:MoxR family ATPase [Actinomycetota bacterium]